MDASAFADSLQPGASSLLTSSQQSDLQLMLDTFPAYTDQDLKDAQVGNDGFTVILCRPISKLRLPSQIDFYSIHRVLASYGLSMSY